MMLCWHQYLHFIFQFSMPKRKYSYFGGPYFASNSTSGGRLEENNFTCHLHIRFIVNILWLHLIRLQRSLISSLLFYLYWIVCMRQGEWVLVMYVCYGCRFCPFLRLKLSYGMVIFFFHFITKEIHAISNTKDLYINPCKYKIKLNVLMTAII